MIVITPQGHTPESPAPRPAAPVAPGGPLRVVITHEFGLPWVTLEYEGKTEDLDHEEALEWFRKHGARDMDKVNEAINYALNFYREVVEIENPVKVARPAGTPAV